MADFSNDRMKLKWMLFKKHVSLPLLATSIVTYFMFLWPDSIATILFFCSTVWLIRGFHIFRHPADREINKIIKERFVWVNVEEEKIVEKKLINRKTFPMKSFIKKQKWILIGILLILTIGNPSMKDFKEYTGYNDATRKFEFLIFSIYSDGDHDYVGVLFNFIKVS